MSGTTTISTTLTSGVTLTTQYTTITATGSISYAGAAAVYAPNGADNTLVNAGQITDSNSTGFGVSLAAGGYVSNAGSIGSAGTGVYAKGAAATVSNSGTISAVNEVGVALLDGGSISNAAAGEISSSGLGVVISGAGTVTNLGIIGGQFADGIELESGGTVSNATGATITGGAEGIALDGTGSVTNHGLIGGTGTYGIIMTAGGEIDDLDHGTISGSGFGIQLRSAAGTIVNTGAISGTGGAGVGIAFESGGRLFNSGTITGAGGTAVSFGAGAASLTIAPGAVFNGAVTANASYVNTLALTTGGAGTLAFGNYTGFSRIAVDGGATWTLNGSVASTDIVSFAGSGAVLALGTPSSFAGTISGLTGPETIDLTTLAYVTGATATITGGVLSVKSGGTTDTLHVSGIANGTPFTVAPDSGTGTEVELLCFLVGTRIATPEGEVPVERLRVGDLVFTWDGRRLPITWIGTGRSILPAGQVRSAATPVIVRKGALADNVPHRDLRLTKGHSLYVDGVLIPVEFLINHHSILWDDAARVAEVYHVELAAHEVLLAEGAAAESYRDDGNRRLFQNVNPAWDAGVAPPPYAPIIVDGPILHAAWHRLAQRAKATGTIITNDPDLHLLVDGTRVDATPHGRGVWQFRIAATPRCLQIVSHAGIPAALGLGPDQRRLGVAVRRIIVSQGAGARLAGAKDTRLIEGFHDFEPAEGWRWTDGAATVPSSLFADLDGAFTLELQLGGTAHYAAAA